ncbi:MAG: rhodanese-like domain-containing protein [Cyanobacteria bacterium J06641_5]
MLFALLPKVASFKAKSRVQELKSRLDWGQPALTIIDTRSRAAFNLSHISGAVPLPADDQLLVRAKQALASDREIYIYGETGAETARTAATLQTAGFANVSEIIGGLAAWKAAGYPIESGC